MKCFIVFLMAFMPMLANAQKVRGDFDGDGHVTVNDITVLIKAYLDEGSGYQSQGELEIPEVQGGKFRLTAEQRQYVTGANAFSFNLFRAVAGETEAGKSMILSPLSVIYALGLANNGASATVSKEISTVLGFGAAGTKDINAFCANLIANAPLLDEDVTLGIANAFFLNSMQGYTLYDAFKTDMQNYYKAMVAELDFREKASCDSINAWAKAQTNGMIPAVLDKLYATAVAYILNALYFKGAWTYPFSPECTWKDTFTKADKSTVTVQMMNAMIDMAAAYGIADRCHFPGFMKGKQVFEIFRDSDVYVMPSVSEPFGISPLEAMQSGVPSIISKQSGCAEILDKCIKTDYWDIDAMADAMYSLCTNDSLHEYLQVEGKKEVDGITWEKVGERIRKLYDQCLERYK